VDGVAPLPTDGGDRGDDWDARDRILALTGPAHRAESFGREGGGGVLATRDRSREAIERQIGAMGVERFDVLLRDAITGATITREWSRAEILRNVAWIKRMNVRGKNIYIKPNGEHGFALLDSLKAKDLASMGTKGFAPAIRVEVTSNEFQAWVKLSDRALPERVRLLAEAGLARALYGHANGRFQDGYGRLAGCVNHGINPGRTRLGKYVLAHLGTAQIGGQTRAFVEQLKNRLQEAVTVPESPVPVQRRPGPERPHSRSR
jgi:hypothetical protein